VRIVRQIACPTCGANLTSAQLEEHLLQSHRAYAFRGTVRPVPESLAVLLGAISSPDADVEAWRAVETLAAHECEGSVDEFLATSLTESLKRQPAEQRGAIAATIGSLLAEHSTYTGSVLRRLATSADAIARQLAWEIVERAPALLTSEILDALTVGMRTHHILERLRHLERRTGRQPVLDAFRAEVEMRVRMRCSRCGAELRRREMIPHLWTVHGLVLDGKRARDPWNVIDLWIAWHQRRPDAGLLERCRELGERTDPEHGLQRVYRRFLAGGLRHDEAQAYLLAEAEEHNASLCPHCYAAVPMPEQVRPARASLSHGRLSAAGYRVEIHESGLFPFLEIEKPGSPPARQRLPGPRLTRQGTMILLVGPLVMLALLIALLPFDFGIPRLVPVLTFLVPALLFAAWIHLVNWRRPSPCQRALRIAWTRLAPTLHGDDFSIADSACLAGLALECMDRGQPPPRARILERTVQLTEEAVPAHPEALHHLAALRALMLADQIGAGGDPVTLTVTQVKRCFAGKLPLVYADELLSLWRREWRTRSNLVRLRVRLMDSAFEAGFEVRNLLAGGQAAPELGRILGTDDPGTVARMRLLWSLRPQRPWDRCGDAETVFSLAESANAGSILSKYPDLLLYQSGGGPEQREAGLKVLVCGRGVVIEGRLFNEPPRTIEWTSPPGGTVDQHVVLLDGEGIPIRGDPDEAVRRIERWFRFYFNEFVGQVAEAYRWTSPHVAAILRAWGIVTCPDCQRRLTARPGEIGISLEDEGESGYAI
jgi:hypothetical protein